MLGWYTLLPHALAVRMGAMLFKLNTAKLKFKPANRNRARFEAMPINVIAIV
jgi:hypothetical protein